MKTKIDEHGNSTRESMENPYKKLNWQKNTENYSIWNNNLMASINSRLDKIEDESKNNV